LGPGLLILSSRRSQAGIQTRSEPNPAI